MPDEPQPHVSETTAARRVQIISGTIPPNARRNGATPPRPAPGGPDGDGDPRAGAGGAGARGAAAGGVERNAHAHTQAKRFGPDYPDADEVLDPNPDAMREWAEKRSDEKDAATDMANRLADEWGVNGARVVVADLGVRFLSEFIEFMNEARARGELGMLRNPAGAFVKKAYRMYDRRREERAAESAHPGQQDGPWLSFGR